ncbi:uncharacterized protein [Montipora capricornis]|uniref:uncharacterized protein n=1 Tax=Montipora capricornis TaxID=246305 RepID=UPI0035F16F63
MSQKCGVEICERKLTGNTLIPGGKCDVAGETFTLVEKEKQFILENLSEASIDSASKYGYGFLEAMEERNEEFLEQFTALNSTCFVRSKTSVKGKDIEIRTREERISENIWKRIQEVVRSRKPKKLQNMTTRLVREATPEFKAQESSTALQA